MVLSQCSQRFEAVALVQIPECTERFFNSTMGLPCYTLLYLLIT